MNKKPSRPSQRNVVFVVRLMNFQRTERKYSTERKTNSEKSLIQSAKFKKHLGVSACLKQIQSEMKGSTPFLIRVGTNFCSFDHSDDNEHPR